MREELLRAKVLIHLLDRGRECMGGATFSAVARTLKGWGNGWFELSPGDDLKQWKVPIHKEGTILETRITLANLYTGKELGSGPLKPSFSKDETQGKAFKVGQSITLALPLVIPLPSKKEDLDFLMKNLSEKVSTDKSLQASPVKNEGLKPTNPDEQPSSSAKKKRESPRFSKDILDRYF